MRLEELYLDGFGHFHQRAFSPDGRRVTVFYGPNEAGKSTLLAFIRTVIFGFPTQRRDEHYPPLSGGRHGGRIRLSGDDDQIYTLERYVGARGGPLAVRDSAGNSVDPTEFMPRITGQASPTVFTNVFAFGIDELQQVGLLDDSSVNEAIYSAGQGVPGLSTFTQRLAARRRDIFLPTGRTQEVVKLAASLREIDEQLLVVERNADQYAILTSRRAEIDAELQARDVERSQQNIRQAEIRNLMTGWEDWVELSNCETQLRSLPTYEQFPDDAIPRLEAFQERARQAKTDSEEAAEHLRIAAEATAAVITGEPLLEAADRVEEIRRGRDSFDGSVHDLPERQAELRNMEADLATSLADLGHQWGEGELEAFDTSLVVRNLVGGWKGRVTESGERLGQAELRLEQERRTLLDRQLETQEAREQLPSELPSMDAAGLMDRQDALRTSKGRLVEYERMRQNYENLRGQLSVLTSGGESRHGASWALPPVVLILLAISGAALAGIGILLGDAGLLMGIGAGLVLIAVAVALWVRGRTGPSRTTSPVTSPLGQQTAEAEASVETSRQALIEAAAPLGLAGQPDGAVLDSAEAGLEVLRAQLRVWESANTRLEDSSRRERFQEQHLADAVKEQEDAAESDQAARREWRQWLQDRQLDGALTPDSMTTFLARVDAARVALVETRRMRDRVAAIENDIKQFRQRVEPLAVAHDIPLPDGNWGQTAVAADTLISRTDLAREAQSRREAAQEQQDTAQRFAEDRQRRLGQAQKELDYFLSLGGTDDPEDFRVRARANEGRLEFGRRRDELIRSLERLSGPGDRLDAFREQLAGADQIQLHEESSTVSERLREVDETRSTLQEERGRIENELERLTGEDESSRLRMHRSILLEQLQDSVQAWSRLTMTEELLDRTRQKFEMERQPKVVQHAQNFFSQITGQRYARVSVPIGERTVTVMDATGGQKQPHELSRGTREQLYLALRFGLVREFGEHAEHLPVVVDEVLVNFDPERARLAAEAFTTLAETNQVLVFTCHPEIVDLFVEAAGAQVIEVESAVGIRG